MNQPPPIPHFDQVEAELTSAIRRDQQPRRRTTPVAAAAAAAAVAALLTFAAADILAPQHRSQVAVASGNQVHTLTLQGGTTPDLEQLEADLAELGLPVRTEPAYAPPSQVGQWLPTTLQDTVTVRVEGYVAYLPDPLPGAVTLQVGVPTPDGQPYAVAVSAFSPGEPLHCLDIDLTDPDAVADALDGRFTVRWQQLGTGEPHREPPERGSVIDVLLESADELLIHYDPAGEVVRTRGDRACPN